MVDEWTKTILEIDLIDGIKHGMCVSNLTYLIAKKLGLDNEACNNLAIAGMVHDIGKLRLSSYLYGRNSNGMIIEEIRYMRMHSRLGYDILMEKGYSQEFSDLITKNLNTDFTAGRMIGYLSHYTDLPEPEIVDEMLAILEDRERFRKKHEMEEAQAAITKIYNEGL